jgi:predicted short-subunit dehydrogenase-like oxidoreductase (DUF2520 family)
MTVPSTACHQPAPSPDDLRFAVVGTGRLGSSLTLALLEAGATLVGHTARSSESRRRAGHLFGLPAADSIDELVAATAARVDVYVLTVPDDPLPEVARLLAEALRPDPRSSQASATTRLDSMAALHASGATSTDVLAPLQKLGLTTLSFHPLQTFSDPVTGAERLRGSAVAVTPGAERPQKALALGRRLAEALHATPFALEERHRAVYHAAACMASNYLVTLEYLAQELFVRSGLPPEDVLSAFLPLVRGTVDSLAAEGPIAALTGPLSRGDAMTIQHHLEGLTDNAPEALAPYRALGRATLELVRIRADLADETLAALEELLAEPELAAVGATQPSRRHP